MEKKKLEKKIPISRFRYQNPPIPHLLFSCQGLCNSIFCLVMPGDGWRARFEDSVTSGCIPVIIQDKIYVPFEGWLDMPAIAVRVPEADIERLHEIIDSIPPEKIAEMSRNSALVSK